MAQDFLNSAPGLFLEISGSKLAMVWLPLQYISMKSLDDTIEPHASKMLQSKKLAII